MPETICDKGSWAFDNDYIRLQSDDSVPKKHQGLEHIYIPITAEIADSKQLFLLGSQRGYNSFKKHAEKNDIFMFLICARARAAPLAAGETAAIKAQLMKKAWRPDSFRD